MFLKREGGKVWLRDRRYYLEKSSYLLWLVNQNATHTARGSQVSCIATNPNFPLHSNSSLLSEHLLSTGFNPPLT